MELDECEPVEAFISQVSIALLRRHARERLLESEGRYRAVFESQQELICRFRFGGKHLVAKEADCRFFGLGTGQIVGRGFPPGVPAEERRAHADYFESISPTGPENEIEHRVVLSDGRIRWLHWHDRAFFDQDGRVEEFQLVGRDVTERKEAQVRLAAQRAELERRVEERTAELQVVNHDLESFTHTVSHDLRAPLRAIDDCASILEHEHRSVLPATVVSYLDQIIQGTRRMGRLIDDLLTFPRAGRQALAVRAIDPTVYVAGALDDLTGEREWHEVRITVGGLVRCSADRALVKQVFAKLIGSALKFTRTRGVVEIAIRSGDEGGSRVYSVHDNGIGLPPKHASAIFESFTRLSTRASTRGRGSGSR
ncbi:MAG: PAS domain S-box protein [Methanospirillum sp.]|nr:PAS domain S-box protein [Methanospirillum sp.]